MATKLPLRQLRQKRTSPEKALVNLISEDREVSRKAGLAMVREAASYGLDLRSFLNFYIDPTKSETPRRFENLTGYEAALSFLDIPIRNDFANGISLELASDTFQTYEGTRAMFPPVIDDMMRWASRINNFELLDPIIAQTRTVDGIEMVTTIIDPDNTTEEKQKKTFASYVVPEGGRVPVSTIRTSEYSVKFYKFGSGLETSYEFERRARIDLLVPFASRVSRVLEWSKVGAATNLIMNGDSVFGAAPVYTQESFDGTQSGMIQWKPLLKFFNRMGQNSTPVDTVLGNWDAYWNWLMLFAEPEIRAEAFQIASGQQAVGGISQLTPAEQLSRMGVNLSGTIPLGAGQVRFALSSHVPDGKIVCFLKSETLEALKENGSDISEMERTITNQTIQYVRSENTGFRLIYGDGRAVYDYKTV